MAAEPGWRALDRTILSTRIWPGESEGVVFNSASGDLHLLNDAALAVVGCLQDQALTLGELSRELPEVDVNVLEQLLAEFDELGLIQPVHP